MSVTIRPATFEKDFEAISSIYARAFKDDPLHNISTNGHPELLSVAAAIGCLVGGEVEVAEIDGVVVAAASWLPPGRELFDSEEQKALAGQHFFSKLEPACAGWFMTYFHPYGHGEAERIFGAGAQLKAYHLQTIGVDPAHQGKGIAKQLIAHQRENAHGKGVPLTLEAITKKNCDIYTKMGFKELGVIDFVGPEPDKKPFEFYLMSWEP
ncbi:acyl-CoA N-acyltransferase [Pterulicium gracile]|uniref:Acyl-CoA N-acyltransferase n=1 Tax=Pterulicium gracile TaxID=1884261 RepID=A0A5C3Q7X1_9AGAR|nr:acyl-CoA N-acyltransferase [Pterula gracilis]